MGGAAYLPAGEWGWGRGGCFPGTLKTRQCLYGHSRFSRSRSRGSREGSTPHSNSEAGRVLQSGVPGLPVSSTEKWRHFPAPWIETGRKDVGNQRVWAQLGASSLSCPFLHTRAQRHSCTWGPWSPSLRSPGSWQDSLPAQSDPVSMTGQDLPSVCSTYQGQLVLPPPGHYLGSLGIWRGPCSQCGESRFTVPACRFHRGCSLGLACFFLCVSTCVCDLEARFTFLARMGDPLGAGSPQSIWVLTSRGRRDPAHPAKLPGAHGRAHVCSLPDGHSWYLLHRGVCPLPGPSHHLLSLHHGEKGPGPQTCPHRPPRGPHGECHLWALKTGVRGGWSCHCRGETGNKPKTYLLVGRSLQGNVYNTRNVIIATSFSPFWWWWCWGVGVGGV